MADNVVDLGGRASKKLLKPSQPIIEILAALLERAKAGDIQQLAVVYVDQTGRPTDGYWPGALPEELIPIIGGLELCKATLLAQMIHA